MGSVYALVAIGFNLIMGVMNLVFFCHGHIVMVGMYAAYLAHKYLQMDPILCGVIMIPIMILVGIIMYRTMMFHIQPKPHSTHIVYTIGLLYVLENLANYFFGGNPLSVTTGYTTSSLTIGSSSIPLSYLYAGVIALVVTVALNVFLTKTDMGKAIRAATDNSLAAKLMGINVKRIHAMAFGLAIAVAAMAGAVMMPFSIVSPFTGMDQVLKSFIIVVVGGLGNLQGALIGGLLLGVVESIFGVYVSSRMAIAMAFFLVMVLILFKPTGLMGKK
jgi:branched-chain amino acid transport system permease protein